MILLDCSDWEGSPNNALTPHVEVCKGFKPLRKEGDKVIEIEFVKKAHTRALLRPYELKLEQIPGLVWSLTRKILESAYKHKLNIYKVCLELCNDLNILLAGSVSVVYDETRPRLDLTKLSLCSK